MLDAAAVSTCVVEILAAPAITIFCAKAICTILTPLLSHRILFQIVQQIPVERDSADSDRFHECA